MTTAADAAATTPTATTPSATPLSVDVWADVLCPWCYIGEARLEKAIAQAKHGSDVELRIHAMQLDPTAPETVTPNLDYLASKHHLPIERARALEGQLAEKAAVEGLPFAIDRPSRNTRDILRLVKLADQYGVGWDYLRALQCEVFSGNPDAYELDTVLRLGAALGVPEAEVRDVIASDRFAADLDADHAAAVRLGAQGVPFTVLGMRLGIPGAVSVEQYAAAIDQAWEQAHA